MANNKEFNSKFLLRCKKCGREFYPWNALMVINEKTDWKEYLYCPSCNVFEPKENFKID